MTPTILYKYRDGSRIDDLRSRTLRLTPPGVLNDPFEGLPAVVGAWSPSTAEQLAAETHRLAAADGVVLDRAEVLAEFDAENALAAEHAAGWFSKLANEIFGIISLAEREDDLLMWSHYGDCHRGFVIGFDALHPWWTQLEHHDDPVNHLVKVVYASERPKTFLADGSLPGADDRRRVARDAFGTKSDRWSYEEEWRIIRPLAAAERLGDGIHVLSFPPEIVKEVIFGWRMSYEKRAAVFEVLDDPCYAGVRRRRATASPTRYSVTVSDV